MHDALSTQVLIYLHLTSLALWFGGLFGYVVIIWPAIMIEAEGRLPRTLLGRIGIRTAPWIYLAMSAALLTFAGIWWSNRFASQQAFMLMYGLVLISLVGNNLYGSFVAWPRIMLLPFKNAAREWFWFRVRMSVALAIGLTLYSAAIVLK